MYYISPMSNITPALVSVAMSRSDSRDSHCSTASTTSSQCNFTSAPMTVSYSSSPSSYRLNRTISNTSSTSSRRPSSSFSRTDSSQWISSPYKSCQLQGFDEPSSFLSDDDLLYIAPVSSRPRELPVERISGPEPILNKKELTTEEQIAMLREMQEKEQQDSSMYGQQQRRQAAARRAVRFADTKPRRTSPPQRRSTSTRKSSLNGN